MTIDLSENARKIFETLYSKEGETIQDTFLRAAKSFSKDLEEIQIAYDLQAKNIWRPNTPVYFNSSNKQKFFSACWVVPLEDSMTGIYDVANLARKIFAYGAGIGIPIGNLREKDAPIFGSFDRTAKCYSDMLDVSCEDKHEYDENNICKHCGKSKYPEGKSSGPLVFMKLYDAVAATTKSGGRARRAAILCCMPIWHPDILEFVKCKEIDGTLSNMNISVGITDKFMQSLSDKTPFPLYTPYDGTFIRNADPVAVWDEIAKMAWKSADPGVLFLDTVNFYNPLKKLMIIQTTNPCLLGETRVPIEGVGEVRIDELINDWFGKRILSSNGNNIEYDFITNVQETGEKEVIELEIEENGEIYVLGCTSEHIIYTANRGEVKAGELSEEDDVIVNKNKQQKIEDINYGTLISRKSLGIQKVYDITTAKNHNFFANGILVHNCGEQPLVPFGCCQLSHINLAKFVDEETMTFDFTGLERTAEQITIFMDNVLDIMDYPDDRFKEVSHKHRPIGLGFMGLADAMFMLDIKYNSQHGRDFVASITKAMTRASIRQSAILAKSRGKFEDYDVVKPDIEEILTKLLSPIGVEDQEVIDLVKQNGLRNCQHTTVAPTGTTALSCDTSYGIEPCFGLVWRKNLITGDVLTLINPIFERRFKGESWWTPDLLDKIAANNGSLKNVRGIPKEVKNVFVVAHDISSKDRVEFQASCQQHLSSAISSTVNLPHDASVEDVKEIFQLAYDLGLKGITIYRDGTKKGQPVTFKTESGVAISNFVRPSGLPAIKHCIQLADEKLYVDVVKYQGKIVEIWMEYGQAGHEVNIILKGWGKTLSTALQHGMPVSAVVKQLKGMKGENPVWFRFEEADKKPTQLYSVCDALAKLLERYYTLENGDLSDVSDALECPKCRNMTYINIEGCYVCQSCGFSKCS